MAVKAKNIYGSGVEAVDVAVLNVDVLRLCNRLLFLGVLRLCNRLNHCIKLTSLETLSTSHLWKRSGVTL